MLITEISKSHLLTVKSSPMATELQQKELERRLSLFQLFRKLYEHHSSFLHEILQLETLNKSSLTGVKPLYLQGVIDTSGVYVITNLCENQTQTLQQPQGIWTIGRDNSSGICLPNRYMSEHHAAIQYNVVKQGFYLIDFNSSNGSFVNGEAVYQPTKLKDGDRIRLGSITFDFYINQSSRVLPTVAIELLMQLVPRIEGNTAKVPNLTSDTENSDDAAQIDTDLGFITQMEHEHDITAQDKSEILDRFFSRHS